MDLSTIRTSISDEKYDHVDEYLKDVHTIFENCYTYNLVSLLGLITLT